MSVESTALWSSFATLVRALRYGNPAWGVPAYIGALFAAGDFEGAELLESVELGDPYFAAVLVAVGRDDETDREWTTPPWRSATSVTSTRLC